MDMPYATLPQQMVNWQICPDTESAEALLQLRLRKLGIWTRYRPNGRGQPMCVRLAHSSPAVREMLNSDAQKTPADAGKGLKPGRRKTGGMSRLFPSGPRREGSQPPEGPQAKFQHAPQGSATKLQEENNGMPFNWRTPTPQGKKVLGGYPLAEVKEARNNLIMAMAAFAEAAAAQARGDRRLSEEADAKLREIQEITATRKGRQDREKQNRVETLTIELMRLANSIQNQPGNPQKYPEFSNDYRKAEESLASAALVEQEIGDVYRAGNRGKVKTRAKWMEGYLRIIQEASQAAVEDAERAWKDWKGKKPNDVRWKRNGAKHPWE